MKKIYLILLLSIFLLQFITPAHYLIGYVNDARDGTKPENYTVFLNQNADFSGANSSQIIGLYGNAMIDNYFMGDYDYPIGTTFYAKVVDASNNTYSNVVSLNITGAGYDFFPFMRLYSSTNSIQVTLPLNNSFNQTPEFKAEVQYNELDSCYYSLNDSTNMSMSVIEEYYPNLNFDFNATNNSNVGGVLINGSYFLLTDSTQDKIIQYSNSGVYTGFSFDTAIHGNTNPIGISKKNEKFLVLDGNGYLYEYFLNGTYTQNNFSVGTGFTDLDCTDNYCLLVDYLNTKVVNWSGTTNDLFNTAIGNDFPTGIAFNESQNNLWITDSNNKRIYRYNMSGSLIDYFINPLITPWGIDEDSTQLLFMSANKYGNLYNELADSKYWSGTESLGDNFYNIFFNCNNTVNTFISSVKHFFTIDTIKPQLTIDNISTTQGSQSFNFDSTETDSNLNTCKYSIYVNGSIDGISENVSFTCNAIKTATATDYGTFTLRIYAIDKALNENYTEENFTLTPNTGGGTGGGGTTINYQPAENFSIVTQNYGNVLDFSLAKDSVKERTKYFYAINNGLEEINLTFKCDTQDTNESTKNISICDYVEFPNSSILVYPNSLNPEIIQVKVLTPENSSLGDKYYFNIIATTMEGDTIEFSKLSVSTSITFLGQVTKWSYLPSATEDKTSYPVWILALFFAILFFALIYWVFAKLKMETLGFFLSILISILVFFLTFVIF